MAVNNGRYVGIGAQPGPIMDVRSGRGGSNPLAARAADFADVGAMRTYLGANGYSSLNLDKMTSNDMVYAIRLISGGIK